MMAFSSGSLLRYEELPTNVINGSQPAEHLNTQPLAMAAGASGGSRSVPVTLQRISGFVGSGIVPLYEVERQAIEQALKYTNGDRTTAAQLLGIGRTTLYRKLKEYAAGTVPQADFPPAA
jgi:DNA-binding NtrC family response regulator